MELKRFLASNMAEAMIKVKSELGSDAVILQTRKIRKGGFFGIGGKLYVEVTAFREDEDGKKVYKSSPVSDNDISGALKDELKGIKEVLKGVNDKLSSVQVGKNFPKPFGDIYTKLVENGMKTKEASSMVEELSKKMTTEEASNREKLSLALKEKFRTMVKTERIDFENRRKIVLIGPTGVGKTTTLAKIAAMIRMKKKMPLMIVTLDTYRIAAAQQVKTYADIMRIPFKVVYTPDEARELFQSVSNTLVLVDTAGRSQKDEMKITEIASYVQSIEPDTVFLVVDATKKRDDVEDVVKRFSMASPTHLVLTKLDETSSMIGVVKALSVFSLPLAFVTNGQNVPDDIVYADEIDIPSLMVEEVLK